MSDFNEKQGIYVHHFETPSGEKKVYVGQAKDMGSRPKASLNEVRQKKGAQNDIYKGTSVYVFDKKVSQSDVNALENKVLTDNGGHKSNNTYNRRGAKGSRKK